MNLVDYEKGTRLTLIIAQYLNEAITAAPKDIYFRSLPTSSAIYQNFSTRIQYPSVKQPSSALQDYDSSTRYQLPPLTPLHDLFGMSGGLDMDSIYERTIALAKKWECSSLYLSLDVTRTADTSFEDFDIWETS
ncbi:hypothetical protein J1614_012250 [Plenodomus biglobosus]|nr:hypothetical protein J1614_012250 [Plenodomus biglobosus]